MMGKVLLFVAVGGGTLLVLRKVTQARARTVGEDFADTMFGIFQPRGGGSGGDGGGADLLSRLAATGRDVAQAGQRALDDLFGHAVSETVDRPFFGEADASLLE
jgi:hypothetical protein